MAFIQCVPRRPAPTRLLQRTSVHALSWRLLPPQLANDPLQLLQRSLISQKPHRTGDACCAAPEARSMAVCPQPEGTQQTLCSQRNLHGPCATVVEQPTRGTRMRSDASSRTSAASAGRAQTASAELAADARSLPALTAYSGAASAEAAGSLAARAAWSQFRPRARPADDAPQGKATDLTGSDRSQQHVRAAASSKQPAEFGSASATRTQFSADCSGHQRTEPASALALSGVLDSSQLRAVQQASQSIDSGRQPRGSRPACGGAPGPRQSASIVPAWGARMKATRHGRSRGAAALPALLALSLLCLAGAPAAAYPIVRAALPGNAATSMAILVCARRCLCVCSR